MAITPQSLGQQVVATPGTPQKMAAAVTSTKKWWITPLKTLPATANVGNIYLGTAAMNKATGAGVMRIITPTTLASLFDRPETSGEYWDLSLIYVDADNGTDGFIVGYLGE